MNIASFASVALAASLWLGAASPVAAQGSFKIGIIDIRAMYGVGSVLLNKRIDMEIHLENWKEKKEYDRLGLSDEYTEIMGVRIPYLVIPVRPGRNLAIIIEVAARNFSLKKMGYSAAKELDRRLNAMMNLSDEV